MLAPVGSIINSCIANLFPACFPPLITLNEGTGKTYLSVLFPASLAKYSYNGISYSAAPARATANDTANIALAPNFYLHQPYSFFVPSISSTINLSISVYFVGSKPINLGLIRL